MNNIVFVPFQIAYTFKRKGISFTPRLATYENRKLKIEPYVGIEGYHYVDAPTYEQVLNWFRTEHNIFIFVDETGRPHVRNNEGRELILVSINSKYAGFEHHEGLDAAILHAFIMVP